MPINTSTSGLGFYGEEFFRIKTDEDLVEESIVRLIMTNFNERVGRPIFGGNLKASIFEQLDDEKTEQIETNLMDIIDLYEPRAKIDSLTVKADKDNSKLNISIYFIYIGKPNGDPRFIPITINVEN